MKSYKKDRGVGGETGKGPKGPLGLNSSGGDVSGVPGPFFRISKCIASFGDA